MRVRMWGVAAATAVAAMTSFGGSAPASASDLSAGVFTMTHSNQSLLDDYVLTGRFAAGGRRVVTTVSGTAQSHWFGGKDPMTISGKGISGACRVETSYTQDGLLNLLSVLTTDVLTCVVSIAGGPSAPMALALPHLVEVPHLGLLGPPDSSRATGSFTGCRPLR